MLVCHQRPNVPLADYLSTKPSLVKSFVIRRGGSAKRNVIPYNAYFMIGYLVPVDRFHLCLGGGYFLLRQ